MGQLFSMFIDKNFCSKILEPYVTIILSFVTKIIYKNNKINGRVKVTAD